MATNTLIERADSFLETNYKRSNKFISDIDQTTFTPFRQKVYTDAFTATKDNPPFPFNYGPDHLGYSIGIIAAGPAIALTFAGINYLLDKQEQERKTNSYVIQHAAEIYKLKLTDKLYWETEKKSSAASEIRNIDQKSQEDIIHIEQKDIHQAVVNPVAYSKKEANRQFILAGLKLHKIINTKLGNFIINTNSRSSNQLYQLVNDIGFEFSPRREQLIRLILNYHEAVIKKNATEADVQKAFQPLRNFMFCGDEKYDYTENSAKNRANPIYLARAYQAKLHNAKYADEPVVDVSFKVNFKDGKEFLDFDFIKQKDHLDLQPEFAVKPTSNFIPRSNKAAASQENQGDAKNDDKQALLPSSEKPISVEKPWMKWKKAIYEFPPVQFVDRLLTFVFDTSYYYWMVWFPYLVLTGKLLTDLVVDVSPGVASLPFVVPAIVPGAYFIGKTVLDVLKKITNHQPSVSEQEKTEAAEEAQKQYDHGRMLYTDNYFTNEKEQLKKKLLENDIAWAQVKEAAKQRYAQFDLKPSATLEEPEPVKRLKARDKDVNKILSKEKFAVGLLHGIFGFLTTFFRAWLISDIIVVASHATMNPYTLLPTAITIGICALTGVYYGIKGVANMKIDQVKEADLIREKQDIIDAISATLAKQEALLKELDPNSELAKDVDRVMKSTKDMLATLHPTPGKWERRLNKVVDFGSHAYTVITRLGTGSLFNRTWLQPGSLIPLILGTVGLFYLPYVFVGAGLVFATFMAVFQVCRNVQAQRIARDMTYLQQSKANFHLEAKRTDYLVNVVTAEKLLQQKKAPVVDQAAASVSIEQSASHTNDAEFENGKVQNGKIPNGKVQNGVQNGFHHLPEDTSMWGKFSSRIRKIGMFNQSKDDYFPQKDEALPDQPSFGM